MFSETPPTTLAVDLATTKLFAEIERSDDDTLITSLIQAATSTIEQMTGRALINRACTLTLDNAYSLRWWQGYGSIPFIRLYKPPIVSVDSIAYIDPTGTPQTLSSSAYQSTPDGRLAVVRNTNFPNLVYGTFGAVTIGYTAGYGPTSATVPAGLATAIMFLVRSWYDHRYSVADVQHYIVPNTVDALISPFVVPTY